MNNRAQTEAFTGINWFPVAHDPTKRLAPKEDDDQSKVDSSLDAAIYMLDRGANSLCEAVQEF